MNIYVAHDINLLPLFLIWKKSLFDNLFGDLAILYVDFFPPCTKDRSFSAWKKLVGIFPFISGWQQFKLGSRFYLIMLQTTGYLYVIQ